MTFPKINRRKFIASVLLATPCAVVADAKLVEPTWLKVSHQKVGSKPAHRFVHFSDLHHKGDRRYLESVVKTINSLAPDFVCFTGDIIEEEKFLPEALEVLSGIKSPMFGVPGNHDYWSKVAFEPIQKCFSVTGGAWLMDERREIAGGKINLIGITCSHANQAMVPLNLRTKNILLMHYPAWVKKLGNQKFDLMLAGHSHGGQVRIPFYGPLIVPFAVDEYDLGMFQTKSGPLYVNSGIGYIFNYNFRFNCRPEITAFEI
ncbi:MAG TPA: metallophosphoesterase [Candidatus Limnocylindrales bacterium]|nr:metallophosphoesterase [Candidatus Limnocylindrales bacterium]